MKKFTIEKLKYETNDSFEELEAVQLDFVKRWMQMEEEMIKKILLMLLNRPPTIEDAKRITIMYVGPIGHSYEIGYEIAFDGVKIGFVKKVFSYDEILKRGPGIYFTPNEEFSM